jgi:type IX secretion system PorP/SprF family membrane protein
MIFSKTKYFPHRPVQFIAFFAILFICCRPAMGQAVEMSQYWAAPLYVNPALAGISYGPRVSVSYRNQWPELGSGFNGGFTTYMVGIDGYLPKAHSGLGLLYTGDYTAGGLLATNTITGSYAFQVKLSHKVGLRLAIEGSFIQEHINWGQLQFYDMINPYTGFYDQNFNPNPTQEPTPGKLDTYHGDMGAGILFFSDKVYGGFAVRNLITPNLSFYAGEGGKGNIPYRFVGHFGSNFDIKHARNYRYNIFVSPNVLIANQGRDVQFNAGLMAGVSLIYFGSWFRYAFYNPDAIILVVGIRKGRVRFGYSYDVTVSRLAGRTGGSHELTLVFNWSGSNDNSLHPHIDKNYIQCPEILNF